MNERTQFQDLIARTRAGDEEAATELVRCYEPYVRREIRLNLLDPGLRRHFDTMDVCQSVLASFFLRVAGGEYDLSEPSQLVKLLIVMARNKLASAVRRQQSQKREHRRTLPAETLELHGKEAATPSAQAANQELLVFMRAALTEEEKHIADLRAEGLSWEDVAQRVGGSAQARRMQMSRAMDRVIASLGLLSERAHE